MGRRYIGVALATAALALPGCLLRGEPPPALTRGPYVMTPTPTSITIAWSTGWPTDSRVDYGIGPGYGGSVFGTRETTAHVLTVTGLEAGALYHDQIVSDGEALAEGHTFASSRWTATRTPTQTLPSPPGSRRSWPARRSSGPSSSSTIRPTARAGTAATGSSGRPGRPCSSEPGWP